MALMIALSTALATGFLSGAYVFRRSGRWQRWCPTCGVTTVCPLGHRSDGARAIR
ncbi:MAG TPA: hypothetical protein VF657_23725 [Actinoplanes sp.]